MNVRYAGCRRLVTWSPRKRSEEHTSELQSRLHLVCRLLLEKKKTIIFLLLPAHTTPISFSLTITFISSTYCTSYMHSSFDASVCSSPTPVTRTSHHCACLMR